MKVLLDGFTRINQIQNSSKLELDDDKCLITVGEDKFPALIFDKYFPVFEEEKINQIQENLGKLMKNKSKKLSENRQDSMLSTVKKGFVNMI